MLETIFKFSPIGQGCFYTGKITIKNKFLPTFNFIYDCGSNSEKKFLNRSIDIYRKDVNSIDLMIISHFDADHVNGISKLLSDVKCKKLVIPYYYPIERFNLSIASKKIEEDYLEMLQNPINYFSDDKKFDIDEIIVIGGPDNKDDDFENTKHPNTPLSDHDYLSEINCEYNKIDDKETEQRVLEIERLENQKINTNKLSFLKKPYDISIGIWEFFFYLKKGENINIMTRFSKDIDELLINKKISMSQIFNPELINYIRTVYRKHYGQNLNFTSIVTYHGASIDFIKGKTGTLLTGDIDLNHLEKIKKIKHYFKHYLNKVSVFQIPHHGSRHSWSFETPNGLEDFDNYIINYGVGRIHHPSLDVISYLKKNYSSKNIHLNNENSWFIYEF